MGSWTRGHHAPRDSLINGETGRLWRIGDSHQSASLFPTTGILSPTVLPGQQVLGERQHKFNDSSRGFPTQVQCTLSDGWWLPGFGQVPPPLWVSISPSVKWRWPLYLPSGGVKIQPANEVKPPEHKWCLVSVHFHSHVPFHWNQPPAVLPFPLLCRVMG